MKRDPSDTDRSYRVESCEHGAALYGRFAPTDDVSSLLYTWCRKGWRFLSQDVAHELGATIAVTESAGTAAEWLAELEGNGDAA